MNAAEQRLLTYLGPAGSFTHAAIDLFATPWTGRVEPRDSVADVIFSVESGEAEAGLVLGHDGIFGGETVHATPEVLAARKEQQPCRQHTGWQPGPARGAPWWSGRGR